jgi:cytochrome P450
VDGFMPADADEKTQVVRRFFTDWMVFQDPPEHTRLRKLVIAHMLVVAPDRVDDFKK